MMRILLDSDVILDYVLRRENFDDAQKLFEALAKMEFIGYVSAIALLNIHYFAAKEGDAAFAKGEVIKLLSLFSVCTIDESSFHSALTLGFDDYEDAVQCASAIAEGLDAIVTRNIKDFEYSRIRVHTPAEFLELLKTQNGPTE